ncbi:Hypothetical protein R9X50_00174900 [Acrodontium crateriforme]|uniref:methionyl-tRNA formyltransferase n=1 Tax=Acrodontium crateriforme TaxID=150365 RepID=A0AAQ3RAB1_9PEZI|nr:Hypothetical protein R9X50_00174900 [Acrodontium crateriforme]
MYSWTSRVRPVVRHITGCLRCYSSATSGRQHGPLRILFCGADEFSIYSLRALDAFQKRQPGKIDSISVVCRPDKRVGRGLKKVQEVPIKSVATELGLRLHQIDTFTLWSPPDPIDLILTASFGLKVPSRILNMAQYGGLNVHPSILPDLRGPSPIQYALLKRKSHTGVTIQTMHPTKFDHGKLVLQTPRPGVPITERATPHELLHSLGPIGAELLCDTIDKGLFIEPIRDLNMDEPVEGLSHAPKITPEDRHIDWTKWSADEIQLRDRVLGRLWDMTTYKNCGIMGDSLNFKRTTFHGPWSLSGRSENVPTLPGTPRLTSAEGGVAANQLALNTIDGKTIIPSNATIEGGRKGAGLPTLIAHLQKQGVE